MVWEHTMPERPVVAVAGVTGAVGTEMLAVLEQRSFPAERVVALASAQPGFLGMESVRDGLGITVSYWQSLEAIANWKKHAEHQVAQQLGRAQWYSSFRVRVARVEREYGM